MNRAARRRLEARQRTLFDAAVDGVRDGDDAVVGESLAQLEQVRTLLDMEGTMSLWRVRLIPLGLLIAVTVGVLLLASNRVSSARVELDATTSHVRVRSATEQLATPPLRLAAAAFTGARHIVAPPDLQVPAQAIALSLSGAQQPITLEPVKLQPGDWIAFETEELPGEYRLVVTPADNSRAIRLAFSIHGTLNVAAGDMPEGDVLRTVDVPRQVTATWPVGEPAILTFSTDEKALSARLNIQALDLDRTTFVSDVPTPESALSSAKIGFLDYRTTPIVLPDGERVRTERLDGRLRRIDVVSGGLNVNVQGEAVALQVANGNQWRSILPTLLESARDRSEVTTLWASAATALMLLLSWIRWWKEPL